MATSGATATALSYGKSEIPPSVLTPISWTQPTLRGESVLVYLTFNSVFCEWRQLELN